MAYGEVMFKGRFIYDVIRFWGISGNQGALQHTGHTQIIIISAKALNDFEPLEPQSQV